MQLPVEIRVMILRSVLVHDGPLRARNWYGEKKHPKVPPKKRRYMRSVRERKEEVAESYELSPEILATCQTLFNEGYPLLYSSNTLGLQICEGDIDFVGSFQEMPRHCGCGTVNCQGGMFMYAIPYVCTRMDDPHAATISTILKKFDKVHIDINNEAMDFAPDEDGFYDVPVVRQVLLKLADRLQNKAVQVKFINPNRASHAKRVEEQLAELMLLRCKEFKILNTDLPEAEASTVAAVVTSDRPIFNLYEMLQNFKDYCRAICCACDCVSDHYWECEYDEDIWELTMAVRRLDTPEFLEVRAKILETIDGRTKRVAKLRDQVVNDSLVLEKADIPAISLPWDGYDD